ncbi:hypothetical protein [Streptomyces chartreusis]|uniref:hypothetical protein n=1 Tax=Streptomyces chartreusis TaxID=1969 RepID=UPI003AEF600C
MTLYDTSRPWHGWAEADTGAVDGIMVQLPRQLLPVPQDKVRLLTAVRLSGREGMGALLAGFLRQMVADATSGDDRPGGRREMSGRPGRCPAECPVGEGLFDGLPVRPMRQRLRPRPPSRRIKQHRPHRSQTRSTAASATSRSSRASSRLICWGRPDRRRRGPRP